VFSAPFRSIGGPTPTTEERDQVKEIVAGLVVFWVAIKVAAHFIEGRRFGKKAGG